MAKHITKVDPQVRSLVAWQQARRTALVLKELLKADPRSAGLHEIARIGERLTDTIERGELSKSQDARLAALHEAMGMIDALRQKITAALSQTSMTESAALRLQVGTILEETRSAIHGLLIARSP